MGKSIKGSQTEKNLLAAFAGESQARNRYTYFASAARKEGYEQIANLFLETAENEKEHAKIFLNLEAAAAGEKMEWTTIYKDFAGIAKKEGYPEVARSFDQIAKVEQFHESRYRKLIKNVANGEVFKKKKKVKWHCMNCGYVIEGTEPPKNCPACLHPKAFYEVLAENY
jgi:rubrerythrin